MVNAAALYWPDKAKHLSRLARESVRLPIVQLLAAHLALAGAPGHLAAAAIRDAVASRVAYVVEPGDTFERADVVLRRGVDDCDGHAIVAASLAAASGFHARIVGVSYPGDRQPAHVRAEVSDDGRVWWPADSTPVPQGIALDLHHPIADVASPARPVGLLGIPIPFVDDILDAGIDIVGGALDAVGLDQVADWLTGGARAVLDDPAMAAAALGVAAACVSAPPTCGAAVAAAKGMVVAEGVRRFGPQHWRRLAVAEVRDLVAVVRDGSGAPRRAWSEAEESAGLALAARTRDPALAARLRGGRTAGQIQADALARNRARRRTAAPCQVPPAWRAELRELGIEADSWCAASSADHTEWLARAARLRASKARPAAPCAVPDHLRGVIAEDAYCAASEADQVRMVAEAQARTGLKPKGKGGGLIITLLAAGGIGRALMGR
jgi:hypothetical protein